MEQPVSTKLKLYVEINQELWADYQMMLEEVNAECREQHCPGHTASTVIEAYIKGHLLQHHINKAHKKYGV